MASFNPQDIFSWMDNISGIDRLNFRCFRLNDLFACKHIKLCTDLLIAAIQCWVPKLHVFRFGSQEICPLFEEFSAILHSDPYADLIVPPVQTGYVQDIACLLHISSSAARLFIHDREINFPRLFATYAPAGASDGDY